MYIDNLMILINILESYLGANLVSFFSFFYLIIHHALTFSRLTLLQNHTARDGEFDALIQDYFNKHSNLLLTRLSLKQYFKKD